MPLSADTTLWAVFCLFLSTETWTAPPAITTPQGTLTQQRHTPVLGRILLGRWLRLSEAGDAAKGQWQRDGCSQVFLGNEAGQGGAPI